jgi:hypothetical protein
MRFKYDIESENDFVRSWRRRVAYISGNGEAPGTSTCCTLDRTCAGRRARVRPPLYAERAGVPRFPGQPGPHGLTLRGIFSLGGARHG